MDLPALTTEQMVEVDRLMIEEYGILLIQMMENAGRSLTEMARRMLGGRLTERRVVVLCGRGNNGGGGMVAARHLHNRGATVSAKLIGDPTGLKEIPGHQWDILQMMALTQADDPDLGQVDLIVDAIIGYGLQGNPRGVAAEWIRRANESGRPVLALDAPSGLDTTTGAVGEPCIKARATLTLALPKVGLLSPGAAGVVGQLYVADIGVPPELYGRLGLEVGPLFKDDVIVGLPRQQSPKPGSPSNSLRRSGESNHGRRVGQCTSLRLRGAHLGSHKSGLMIILLLNPGMLAGGAPRCYNSM